MSGRIESIGWTTLALETPALVVVPADAGCIRIDTSPCTAQRDKQSQVLSVFMDTVQRVRCGTARNTRARTHNDREQHEGMAQYAAYLSNLNPNE